ncbi:hypothetical protein LCM17_09560 [Cereibacter sphaeroides]|nr:hypothetical protein [Cereibacter sphaeroides]
MRLSPRVCALFLTFLAALVAPALTPERAEAQQPELIQIEAGQHFTCALDAEGGVWCWGINLSGQLGDGTTENRANPVQVQGLDPAIAISAGGYHACALHETGRVSCWGSNNQGQLGNGQSGVAVQSAPVTVLDLRNITAVAAGGQHTCALNGRGRVFCWGDGYSGQLGLGSNEDFPVRQIVPGLTRVNALSAGSATTCATTRRSEEFCWGRNFAGLQGDGTGNATNVPTLLARDNMSDLDPASSHTCGLNARGFLMCWGSNQYGQLGNPNAERRQYLPIRVNGLRRVRDFGTGHGSHTCALTRTGRPFCWGWNSLGQLGDGTFTDRGEPVPVFYSRLRYQELAVGSRHTCALQTNNRVRCWGQGQYGQLGNGALDNSALPVFVRWP